MESKVDHIRTFQDAGYAVALLFVGLTNEAISVLRVRTRQQSGGHAVPEDKLILRFPRTQRAIEVAAGVADLTLMFDNSRDPDKAFSLVRAQTKSKVLYDCRTDADQDDELLAVSRPWLNKVAP